MFKQLNAPIRYLQLQKIALNNNYENQYQNISLAILTIFGNILFGSFKENENLYYSERKTESISSKDIKNRN
jgi:hypothetical protein